MGALIGALATPAALSSSKSDTQDNPAAASNLQPILEKSRDAFESGETGVEAPQLTEEQREAARRIVEQSRENQGDSSARDKARRTIQALDESASGKRYSPDDDAALKAGAPDGPSPYASAPTKPDAGDDPDETGDLIRVFTTLGETDKERQRFKRQLETLAGHDKVRVVLRGLPPGVRRIDQMMRRVATLEKTVDDAPRVDMDPTRFKEIGVEVAPTVVYYRDDEPLARMTGSLEIQRLQDKVAEGERGDLGKRGEAHEITERNLMSIIRERWDNVDWEAKKKQAKANFWRDHDMPGLPEAGEDKRFTVNPTFEVSKTITTPRGNTIAEAGDLINPLTMKSFTAAFIAFDASHPEQIEVAQDMVSQARDDGLRVILATQGFPEDNPSFEALTELRQTFGGQKIYTLNQRLIKRFEIEALPTVVREAEDSPVFSVRQRDPDKVATGDAS